MRLQTEQHFEIPQYLFWLIEQRNAYVKKRFWLRVGIIIKCLI